MTVSVQRSMSSVSCTRHDFPFRLLPIVPDEPFHVMRPFPEIPSGNRNRWCALSNVELNGIRWHPSAVWASRSARGAFPCGPHWCHDTGTERYTAVTLTHGVFPYRPHWSHDTSTEHYTAVTLTHGVFPYRPHWSHDTSTERYTIVTLTHGVFTCGPLWSHDTNTERYTAVTLTHGVFTCWPHWSHATSTERYTIVTLTHGVFPYRPHWSHDTSTERYTAVTLTHVLTVQCRRGFADTHRYSGGGGTWWRRWQPNAYGQYSVENTGSLR